MNSKKYLSLSGLSIFYSKFKEWLSSTFTTEEYVDTKIADLVNSAPDTLDTLGELAAAFQENDEVVEVLNNAITVKADKTYVDELIADIPTESDVFIIDCPDGSVISHTFEQIKEAIDSGKVVYAYVYGVHIIPLIYVADDASFIEFSSVRSQDTTTWIDGLIVNSDNSFVVKHENLLGSMFITENELDILESLLV